MYLTTTHTWANGQTMGAGLFRALNEAVSVLVRTAAQATDQETVRVCLTEIGATRRTMARMSLAADYNLGIYKSGPAFIAALTLFTETEPRNLELLNTVVRALNAFVDEAAGMAEVDVANEKARAEQAIAMANQLRTATLGR